MRASLIYGQGPSFNILAIPCIDGGIGFGIICHSYKTKTLGDTSFPVHNNDSLGDLAVFGEHVSQIGIGGFVRQIAYEKLFHCVLCYIAIKTTNGSIALTIKRFRLLFAIQSPQNKQRELNTYFNNIYLCLPKVNPIAHLNTDAIMYELLKKFRSITFRNTEIAQPSLKLRRARQENAEKRRFLFCKIIMVKKIVEKKEEKQESRMSKFLDGSALPPAKDSIVEGAVIAIAKNSIFVDLPPWGTGVIFGKEYINARDLIKKINIGDRITGKIVGNDNKEGYIEISLKEAKQALIWSDAEEAIRDKKVFEIPVKEANKGGLMLVWQGITGFLPASQLKMEHYPRISDGDKDRILEELRKLVGQKLSVAIIATNAKEGKLIFSEKDPDSGEKEKIIDKYSLGDELEGEVTGIVDFGIFVKIEEGLEGLVHISEIDWGLVDDPHRFAKVGDKIKVKIIEIKDSKISLSIKALKENPWTEASKKYKKDDVVSGVVIKFNKHGALASIEEGVAGLIHISEFGTEEKLREKLELGKTYNFKINIFDPKEQKMALSFVEK